MPRLSPTKTKWFFDSEGRNRGVRRDLADVEQPLIDLRGVSLKFINYADKTFTIKRAFLQLLLRREKPVPDSEFWALRNINLRIRQGERIGILGSNGAGKSTLLRLLAKIYPPTTGEVAVRGTVAPLIEMGAGFNPELTGFENILLNGAILGFNRKRMLEKVEEIHEFTGLREFADLPLKYYSSGMYSRLAFGVATSIDPEILLVDESLSAGDAAFREKATRRIRDLMKRSRAVILVSHDMGSLRKLCDRGLWLRKGELIADGPIKDVIDDYEAWTKSIKTAPA